jgi:dihydroorotase
MENEVKKINIKGVTFENLQDFMSKNNIRYFVLKPEQSTKEALEKQQWVLEGEKNKFVDKDYIFIERRK